MASGQDSVLGCYGQPWTAVAVGWPGCWGLWDMPHASPSLPHLNKYLLSTCCVSVRDQRSGVSSPPRTDPARALGVVLLGAVFSPRKLNCVHRPWAQLLVAPSALRTAGWGSGEGACRVLCMEPSSGFLGSQGGPNCFWASVPSSVLSPLCNPCPLALTSQSLSP